MDWRRSCQKRTSLELDSHWNNWKKSRLTIDCEVGFKTCFKIAMFPSCKTWAWRPEIWTWSQITHHRLWLLKNILRLGHDAWWSRAPRLAVAPEMFTNFLHCKGKYIDRVPIGAHIGVKSWVIRMKHEYCMMCMPRFNWYRWSPRRGWVGMDNNGQQKASYHL